MLTILLAVAGSEKIVYDGSIGLRSILNSAGIGSVGNYEDIVAEESKLSKAESFLLHYTANESVSLSMLSPSFISFVQHDYNVKHGMLSVNTENSDKNDNDNSLINTVKPTEKPSASDNGGVTEIPTESPTLNDSGLYKYYLFTLENNTYGVSLAGDGASVATGLFSDNCTEKDLNVGDDDFIYGNMTIQNSHGAEGFDLRQVLSSPLKIPTGTGIDSERVLIYYTHTSEGYCTKEADKDLTKVESVSSRDNSKNVVSCGSIIAEELNKKGVSVLNRTDVNDEDYNTAYQVSGQLLKDVTGKWKNIDLAIDVHSDALEYPKGTRYSASTVSDGVSYAKMSFVITVGEENPHWQENIRLSIRR
jgi:stage II sporulation protein P